MARRAPRRIYLVVLAALAVILILLAGVYLQIDRPASPTSTTASGQAGVPVFQYSVSGPSEGAFRLRGVAIAGSKAFAADSDGGRLVVLDLARGEDGEFTFIPIAPDRLYETIPNPPQPISVAVSPDGTLLVTDLATVACGGLPRMAHCWAISRIRKTANGRNSPRRPGLLWVVTRSSCPMSPTIR